MSVWMYLLRVCIWLYREISGGDWNTFVFWIKSDISYEVWACYNSSLFGLTNPHDWAPHFSSLISQRSLWSSMPSLCTRSLHLSHETLIRPITFLASLLGTQLKFVFLQVGHSSNPFVQLSQNNVQQQLDSTASLQISRQIAHANSALSMFILDRKKRFVEY